MTTPPRLVPPSAPLTTSTRRCGGRSSPAVMLHAPTEVVLTRQCADVSKLTYHLRLNGDKVDHSLLAMFDSQLRSAISASLFGNFPDDSWWQATTGVLFGGLGFRTAQSMALFTFIANRLVSRPLVRTLLEHFGMATGAPLPLLQRACDRRTEDAVLSLISTLQPNSGALLLQQLDQGMGERDLLWYLLSLPR